MDEESSTNEPPDAVGVVRRALILSGVICRCHIDGADDEVCRETAAEIEEWFDELELWPYMEPTELKVFKTQYGGVSEPLCIQGTWRVEGLAILAWALNRLDFPNHSEKVKGIALVNSLDFLDVSKSKRWLKKATLRRPAEIESCREWYYDLHVTIRQFLHYKGKGDLAEWISKYQRRLGIKASDVRRKRQLLFRGKPLHEASREELIEWEHLICERHRAAIWLAGEYSEYTELNVDT